MARSSDIIAEVEAMEIKGAYLNAVRALDALRLVADESLEIPASEMIAALDLAAARLSGANRSWAVVSSACNFVTERLSFEADHDGSAIADVVRRHADVFQTKMQKAQKTVGEVGAELIPDGATVLIMSYSGTLLEIFRTAKDLGRKFDVIGTESRPKAEGRAMAIELVQSGISCTLITDPAQADFVRRGDMGMVGVDTLAASGAVVNKVGTMNLALACRYFDVPLYAATSTFKMSLPSLEGEKVPLKVVEDRYGIGPDELDGNPLFRVENLFFEETPPELFKGLITEYGVHPPTSARALWERTWAELEREAEGELE